MRGSSNHALDDLFIGETVPFAPLYRRAMFGRYAFKNAATLEAFASAQRTLYDALDSTGRKRQRELLIKLCDAGAYPPLPQAPVASTALADLLTPAERPETHGGHTYRRFGKYLVQQEVVDDFLLAHTTLAHYEEELVRAILATICSGGPAEREVRLVDNNDWNTAFILAPDRDGRYTVQWDRRMMLCDRAGALVPSPLLLLHEEQHAADVLNDAAGTMVLQATPSKEYGDHLEAGVITGIEKALLRAMGLPPRESFHALIAGALHLTSTQISLNRAQGEGEYQRVGEHTTTGRIVAVRNHEVLIRDEFGTIIRYELRELSHFVGLSLERAVQGKHGESKFVEKRILNALRLLHDAGVHKDTITIGIRGNDPPTYANAQQLARESATRGKPAQAPVKSRAR
jgi:hypothetical protein